MTTTPSPTGGIKKADPVHVLENALTDLMGAHEALRMLAEGAGDFENALSYLANRIEDHTRSAHEAYCQLFGLDDFSEQSGGPGSLVRSVGGAP